MKDIEKEAEANKSSKSKKKIEKRSMKERVFDYLKELEEAEPEKFVEFKANPELAKDRLIESALLDA